MLCILLIIKALYLATMCTAKHKNENNFTIAMVSGNKAGKPAIFQHGESPVWDSDTNMLYFVDVYKQRVHRLHYETGKIDTKHIGYGQVNVVMPVANSSRLLVAVRAALYIMDFDRPGDFALRLLTQLDPGLPSNILNEGKADAKGRFWGGTKGPQAGKDVVPNMATFYSVEEDSFTKPKVQLWPVSISNGITWSLNNSLLYYIDSITKTLDVYDFDLEEGTIGNKRTIIHLDESIYGDAIMDGMTIDTDGNLWVALMFGGKVLHIDPDKRQVVKVYDLPASRTTSVGWGGPNLDVMFVTSGYKQGEKHSGALFSITDTGSRGVPSYKFKFDSADIY